MPYLLGRLISRNFANEVAVLPYILNSQGVLKAIALAEKRPSNLYGQCRRRDANRRATAECRASLLSSISLLI